MRVRLVDFRLRLNELKRSWRLEEGTGKQGERFF